MQKNTLNFIIDCVATVAMLVMILTGLLLWLILPPGSRGGHGLELWGWSRHDWGDLHLYASWALIALVVLHVILHWDWVCLTVYRWINPAGFREKRFGPAKQWITGILFLLLVAGGTGLFVWAADQAVIRSGGEGHGAVTHEADGERGAIGKRHQISDNGAPLGERRGRGQGDGRGRRYRGGRSGNE